MNETINGIELSVYSLHASGKGEVRIFIKKGGDDLVLDITADVWALGLYTPERSSTWPIGIQKKNEVDQVTPLFEFLKRWLQEFTAEQAQPEAIV